MTRRRVVITGIGLLTPIGNSTEETWDALIAGKSGIAPITHFDAAAFETRIAGELKNFDALKWMDKKEARRLDLFEQYMLIAGMMAKEASGLTIDETNAERVGCVVGTGVGGIGSLEQACYKLRDSGPARISPFLIPQLIPNLGAGVLAIHLGAKGVNWAPASACATGGHSIGEAAEIIRRGTCDVMFAGGAEAPITPASIAGFNAAKAMCTTGDAAPEKASRPFDMARDGFIPSEGSGVLVLEELEHALARGAHITAEVAGYGANCDAYHITAPSPHGEGAARCMKLALNDAGLAPEDIGYINAHGTSTQLNDKNETEAIKAVFGEHARRLPVSATKSMTGHLLGAAGAIEAAFTALTLERGIIPPTINYETPDPDCDLDYVPNTARKLQVEAAMSNGFGFGGTNAVLVLKRWHG